VQILRQRRRKTTNTAPTILLVQYKHQAKPLISRNDYIPFVINRNDKNKQLTLLSQRILALTAINKLLQDKIIGAPKKFKTQPRPLVNPSSVNLSTFFKSISRYSLFKGGKMDGNLSFIFSQFLTLLVGIPLF
jgi:hypothetical protein